MIHILVQLYLNVRFACCERLIYDLSDQRYATSAQGSSNTIPNNSQEVTEIITPLFPLGPQSKTSEFKPSSITKKDLQIAPANP